MKIARLLFFVPLIWLVTISGCGKSQTQDVVAPFGFDYTVDEAVVRQVVEGDNLQTLIASNPFYAGAAPLPGDQTASLAAARRKKVDEIISTADTLVTDCGTLKADLDSLTSAFMDYLNASYKQNKKLAPFVNQTAKDIVRTKSLQATTLAVYESIDTSSDSPLVSSYMEYTRVSKAVELGGLCLKDANELIVFASLALKATENGASPAQKKLNADLDKAMSAYDGMRKNLEKIGSGLTAISGGFRQLETSDYYLAQATASFIAEEMPHYKQKAASIKPRGKLTQEHIDFINQYLEELDKTNSSLQKALDSADKARLVETSLNTGSSVDAAWAEDKLSSMNMALSMDAIKKAGSAIPYSDQGTRSFSEAISKGWSDLKSAVQGAQKAAGVAIDTLGATTRSVMNVPIGVYYGNSVDDICDNIKQNFGEVAGNFEKGVSGTGTWRTAKDYFEGAENAAQSAAESGASAVMGEGYTSWVLGHIAKATASIFTGMGKGISAVADSSSDAGEFATGVLDIGLAVTGGSKVIFQGTKAPALVAGAGEGAEILVKKGANFVTQVVVEGRNKQVNQLLMQPVTGQAAVILGSTKQALMTALKKTSEQLNTRLADLIKKGASSWAGSARETLESSLNDYVKKQFEANIGGFVNAVKTALGESAGSYINNVMGEMADDYLKDMVKQALDEQPVFDGVYKGTIAAAGIPGTMTMTVSGITVTGSIRGTYTGKPSEFVKANRVPFSASFSGKVFPNPDKSGKVACNLKGSMRDKDGDSWPFSGKFNGKLIEGSGSGTWSAANEWGSHSGTWAANQ